jgi:hypothetical protein
MTEIKAALPTHETDVDTTSAWDNGFHERRVKSPADREYYSQIYAYLDPEGNPDRKSSYSFIHHMMSADGEPGAANFRALATGIATLNGGRAGTVLRGRDRERVYAHLAAHYRDADREAPALLPESEIRCMNEILEIKDSSVLAGSQISWIDDDGESIGTVIEISEKGEILVRQWKTDEEAAIIFPTENFVTLYGEEVEKKVFMDIDPDMVKQVADGGIVVWETTDGEYYGDVLTIQQSGELRGEPQGMTLEATEERPVALVRVWMWDEDEWIPTNTNVVAYTDMLKPVDSLPNPMAEDMETEDTTPEAEPMMEDSGIKSAEFIASVVAKVLEEMGVKLDPPAGFSNKPAEERVAEDAPAETEVTTEVEAVEEVAVVQEAAPEAEVAADEAPAEEAADAPATEGEEKSALTLSDLKEFQDLLRML